MIYLKLVDRTKCGPNAREYVNCEDSANIAAIICHWSLDRQISIRDIQCQVYGKKDWNDERDEQRNELKQL